MRHDETPVWGRRLLEKMETLKKTVENMRKSQWEYLDFLNRFRRRMLPDPERNHYPEVVVNGRRLGVTLDGLLYDKANGETMMPSGTIRYYKSRKTSR
ncbi:hypothetical protein [Hydrogenimonas sp.]